MCLSSAAFQDLWNTLPSSGYDSCPDDHVREFFNKKDVQRAIHANVTNLSYPYTLCRYLFPHVIGHYK